MLRWFRQNFGTLLLAFLLALTVWVAAVSQEDPIVERMFPQPIAITYTGLADEMMIVGQFPTEATISIRAPDSVWEDLTNQDIQVIADLAGLDAGTHRVWLAPTISRSPAQVRTISPDVITLSLEPYTSKEIGIQVVTFNQPALGYIAEEPVAEPKRATVVGPQSAVEQVSELRAEVSLASLRESLDQEVTVIPIDEEGVVVAEVQIVPEQVRVTVEIKPGERYRPVSVIPKIVGRIDMDQIGHFRVTNISVTPSEVIVFSSDRAALDALPGYVETVPLDITDQTQNVERRLPLNLPDGVSLVGEQSVLVQVTIVPVVESITVTRTVEIQGLGPDLYAYPSPDSVDVILTGPAATLDALQPEDVRVVLDMLDIETGTFQLYPQVIVLLPDLEFDAPIPATIEVNVTSSPLPTPTPTS